eukprot:3591388-Prymnesium_polylepis.2
MLRRDAARGAHRARSLFQGLADAHRQHAAGARSGRPVSARAHVARGSAGARSGGCFVVGLDVMWTGAQQRRPGTPACEPHFHFCAVGGGGVGGLVGRCRLCVHRGGASAKPASPMSDACDEA